MTSLILNNLVVIKSNLIFWFVFIIIFFFLPFYFRKNKNKLCNYQLPRGGEQAVNRNVKNIFIGGTKTSQLILPARNLFVSMKIHVYHSFYNSVEFGIVGRGKKEGENANERTILQVYYESFLYFSTANLTKFNSN